MKSALAIQCLPLGAEGKDEVYPLVDRAIEVIAASGLDYTVGPFETVIEGPLDALWETARKAHEAVAASGGSGVATYMKLFTAPDLGTSEEKTSKWSE